MRVGDGGVWGRGKWLQENGDNCTWTTIKKEMYTWNLYDLVNQCLLNKFNKIKIIKNFNYIFNPHLRTFFAIAFRKRGRDRERGRERNIQKHWLVTFLYATGWGMEPATWVSPWQGIEPWPFSPPKDPPANWATVARVKPYIFRKYRKNWSYLLVFS